MYPFWHQESTPALTVSASLESPKSSDTKDSASTVSFCKVTNQFWCTMTQINCSHSNIEEWEHSKKRSDQTQTKTQQGKHQIMQFHVQLLELLMEQSGPQGTSVAPFLRLCCLLHTQPFSWGSSTPYTVHVFSSSTLGIQEHATIPNFVFFRFFLFNVDSGE